MRRGIATVFGATEVPDAIKTQAETTASTLLLAGREFESQVGEDPRYWRCWT